jgi:ABC-type molybdate transport system ATPase subunit
LRVPHETCLQLSKIVGLCTDLSSNERVLAVHQGDVRHFIPLSSDAPSFSLKDVRKFLSQEAILCEGTVSIKDKMLQLVAFADKDSQISFTIKSGKMTASIASKVGKNSVYIAPFDPSESFSFLITLHQVMPMLKYDAENVRVGILLRDDKPFCLYVSFSITGSKKVKTEEADEIIYKHNYIAAASGR